MSVKVNALDHLVINVADVARSTECRHRHSRWWSYPSVIPVSYRS
jgi:hypothetical protein